MLSEENNKRQELKNLYASVNFDFDKFDNVAFFIATLQLKKEGAIHSFNYDYESETDELKEVICAEVITLEGESYNIKYDGSLHLT